jgi:hypothetical protein
MNHNEGVEKAGKDRKIFPLEHSHLAIYIK